MMNEAPTVVPTSHEPPPYLARLVAHFKATEPALWQWFPTTRKRAEEAEVVRLDLLKTTYRLDPATQPEVFALVEELRTSLGIAAPVTLYQAQTGEALNAALVHLPGEAHIIFAGPVLKVFTPPELRALLAHELGHQRLNEGWDRDYLHLTELLRALCQDASAGPEYRESARLLSLYTEVFADRWSLRATNDLAVAVTTLVKAQTGLAEVSADAYLRQAEEIFAKSEVLASEPTHPELYIRARALQLWAEQGDAAQTEIEHMIEGPLALERLDLLGQTRAVDLTRRVVSALLSPPWFRTEATLAHARQFFADFTPADDEDPTLAESVRSVAASLQDYLGFVLLDFATVDRDLDEVALAAALLLSRRLGLDERFTESIRRELGLGKKALARLEKDAVAIVTRAGEQLPP